MNADQFEMMLADYLGDELSPEDRRAFEAHLAEHPEQQTEVDELRETLAELNHLQAAPDREPTLLRANAQPSPQRNTSRLFVTLGKAAAILIFGVIIGRLTASAPQAPPTPQETTPTVVTASGKIHPGWYELAKRVGARNASFAGLLSAGAESLH